jgi:hypothetical protein
LMSKFEAIFAQKRLLATLNTLNYLNLAHLIKHFAANLF